MTTPPKKTEVKGIPFLIALGMIILLVVGVMAIFSMVLMVAWSAFVTPVFGLTLLSFPQAFGAILLLTIFRASVMMPMRIS